MNRPIRSAALMLAAAGLLAAFGSTAYATPGKTSPCSNCHDGPNVPVTATLASNSGATATYSVSAPGADAIAVFSGATKLATLSGSSGQFSVATGKTYTVFAVSGPSTGDGLGSTSVSPVAPPPADTTAPATTSNAKSTYVSTAAIVLTATDTGSGVAHTYWRLDGGAQTEGTAIATSSLGSHSLEFWSVDVAGNVEVHKVAAFTVTTPPPPADTTAPVTTSNALATYVSSAAVQLSATDTGSGVAHTYFRLDGDAQTEGTTVAISLIGSHSLEFWSVDVAGNVEVHKVATFTVTAPVPPADTTAPATTSNAKAAYVSSAAVQLSATDAGSGVAHTYFRLDGGAQTEGTTVATSLIGSHSLEFWSVDVAGNVEVHKVATFNVTAPVPPADTTAPATTSNAKAAYVSSAAIQLSATDAGSGVAHTYWCLDDGAQAEGTTVATSLIGSHSLEFWSVDVAGNVEAHNVATFTVTAPVPPTDRIATRLSIRLSTHRRSSAVTLSGELTPGSGGESVSLYVKRPGSGGWTLASVRVAKAALDSEDEDSDGSQATAWSYRFTTTRRGTYQFQARFAGNTSRTASVSKVVALTVR